MKFPPALAYSLSLSIEFSRGSFQPKFIDTANVYTRREAEGLDLYGKDFDKFEDGISEKLIGEWLFKNGCRKDFVIASKVGFAYPGIEIGTSRKQIIEECEKSLKRLKTDYIDVYYLHFDDKNTLLEESLSAMTDLVTAGKVRYIAISNFTFERTKEAVEIAKRIGGQNIIAIQNKYSYLNANPDADFGRQVVMDADVLRYARENEIGAIAYSPLLKGYYGNRKKTLDPKFSSSESDRRLALLDRFASERGITPSQAVYAWLLSHDPSVIPIVAISSSAQFLEALAATEIRFSKDDMKELSN